MTMHITPSRIRRSVDTQEDRGRVFHADRLGWYLMNQKRVAWLIDFWWQTGFEAGQRAAEKPLTEALRRKRA